MNEIEKVKETLGAAAEMIRLWYLAFQAAGFDDDQSLELAFNSWVDFLDRKEGISGE